MRFLVDANLGREFTRLVNKPGHDAVFVNDILRKASDEDVLSVAEREDRVVITNDKDFGELVFFLNRPTSGVILLRTMTTDPKKRFEMVKGILDKAKGRFTIVREGRIRSRKL